jgi:hypothetical protein
MSVTPAIAFFVFGVLFGVSLCGFLSGLRV